MEKFQKTNILNGKSTGLQPVVASIKKDMARKILCLAKKAKKLTFTNILKMRQELISDL